MAARAIGSATISFGLVAIPVKVYSSGVSEVGIRFNMLEKKTGARVKQQYISTQTGEVVPRDEMIKGYEFSKGQYVTFTNEELKAFDVEANKSVDIKEFVPIEKVDPIFFEKAYYLGPDKGGDRPYKLLRAAMEKTGRAALASYAARGKQYLVLVRPKDEGIVMQQLRYADEIRAITEVPLGEGEVDGRGAEARRSSSSSRSRRTKFKPEEYEDEVRREASRRPSQAKVEGQEVTAEPVRGAQGREDHRPHGRAQAVAGRCRAEAGQARAAQEEGVQKKKAAEG